jgi:hypothetical protein
MNPSNETTPTAAAAGTAFGSLVGIGLSAVTGLAPEITIPSCGIVGAFAFGRAFPR